MLHLPTLSPLISILYLRRQPPLSTAMLHLPTLSPLISILYLRTLTSFSRTRGNLYRMRLHRCLPIILNLWFLFLSLGAQCQRRMNGLWLMKHRWLPIILNLWFLFLPLGAQCQRRMNGLWLMRLFMRIFHIHPPVLTRVRTRMMRPRSSCLILQLKRLDPLASPWVLLRNEILLGYSYTPPTWTFYQPSPCRLTNTHLTLFSLLTALLLSHRRLIDTLPACHLIGQ